MHELAITESLVDCIVENVGDARVLRVVLQIGKLSAVAPDAVRACFDIVVRGTNIEGAALEIDQPDGRARCVRCGYEQDVSDLVATCACGSVELEIVRGRELRIREVEVTA